MRYLPRPGVVLSFDPLLELILAKASDAADFEGGEFAFARETGHSEGVNSFEWLHVSADGRGAVTREADRGVIGEVPRDRIIRMRHILDRG